MITDIIVNYDSAKMTSLMQLFEALFGLNKKLLQTRIFCLRFIGIEGGTAR